MSNYDPYRASTTGYALPPQGPGMQYGRLLSFVFESPNWLMNLVWGALCTLLSSLVVGQLVMHGYQAQIMIGSVHLTWHYAIDGYAGAAIAVFGWWLAGRLIDWARPELRAGASA